MAFWLLACLVCHPLMHAAPGRDAAEVSRIQFRVADGDAGHAALHGESLPCPLCSGFSKLYFSVAEQSLPVAEEIPAERVFPCVPPRLHLPELPSPRAPPAA